jgi:hypothetical protein
MTELSESIEAILERRQANGSITVGDADTVREFAEFLSEVGPPTSVDPEDRGRRRRALIKHAEYCGLTAADVAALQAAEDRANAGGFVCPECAAGKCGICARQALDTANGLIVDCSCRHGGA